MGVIALPRCLHYPFEVLRGQPFHRFRMQESDHHPALPAGQTLHEDLGKRAFLQQAPADLLQHDPHHLAASRVARLDGQAQGILAQLRLLECLDAVDLQQ